MADTYCKFETGPPVTCQAAAALTGGRMVQVSGAPVDGNPLVNVPAAGGETFGVAARDAASGAKCTVYSGDNIVWIEAGATLTADDIIESNASGQAIVRVTGVAQGKVLEGGASGALCLIAYSPRSV